MEDGPIFDFCICLLACLNVMADHSDKLQNPSRPSWQSSTAVQKVLYKVELENRLSIITIFTCILECKDISWKNRDHCDLVDQLTQDVLETVQETAEEYLVCPGGGSRGRGGSRPIPGWNENIKQHIDTATSGINFGFLVGNPSILKFTEL